VAGRGTAELAFLPPRAICLLRRRQSSAPRMAAPAGRRRSGWLNCLPLIPWTSRRWPHLLLLLQHNGNAWTNLLRTSTILTLPVTFFAATYAQRLRHVASAGYYFCRHLGVATPAKVSVDDASGGGFPGGDGRSQQQPRSALGRFGAAGPLCLFRTVLLLRQTLLV